MEPGRTFPGLPGTRGSHCPESWCQYSALSGHCQGQVELIVLSTRWLCRADQPGKTGRTHPRTCPPLLAEFLRNSWWSGLVSDHVMSGIWRIRHPLQVKYLFLSPSGLEGVSRYWQGLLVITKLDEGFHQPVRSESWYGCSQQVVKTELWLSN